MKTNLQEKELMISLAQQMETTRDDGGIPYLIYINQYIPLLKKYGFDGHDDFYSTIKTEKSHSKKLQLF